MGGFRWGLSGNVGYVFPGNVFRPDRDLRFRHAEGVHGVPHIGRQHKKASGKFAGGFFVLPPDVRNSMHAFGVPES